MRHLLLVLSLLLMPLSVARAEVDVSIGIRIPGVSIGINVPAYPRLVRVPGYPVYYDPSIRLNLFFYDGLFWVFQHDRWYVSTWFNGPWDLVDPYDVPVYLLWVPVRYYRLPPPYFRPWRVDAPPRWDEHWGKDWHDRRRDWEHHDARPAPPPPAPLPSYQKKYTGKRYPQAPEKQYDIRNERYKYQPREAVTQKHYEKQRDRSEKREKHDQGRGHR